MKCLDIVCCVTCKQWEVKVSGPSTNWEDDPAGPRSPKDTGLVEGETEPSRPVREKLVERDMDARDTLEVRLMPRDDIPLPLSGDDISCTLMKTCKHKCCMIRAYI